MNEFEHTLTNILAKHGISVSDLAERAGYSPLSLARSFRVRAVRYP